MGQGTIGYRWNGEREVTIAYSLGTPAEVRTEALSVMEELTGTSAAETQLAPLADSNNCIQLIDDDTTWHALYSFVEIVVGARSAAGEAPGEEDWRDRKKVGAAIKASVSTPLRRLAQLVSKCKKSGTTVIAARPIALAGHVRNVGVELASDDPEDIAWKIAHLAEFGFPVGLAELASAKHLDSDTDIERKSDSMIRIEVADSGRVVVFGLPADGKTTQWVAYDPAMAARGPRGCGYYHGRLRRL